VIGEKQIHRLSPIGTDEFLQAYAVSSETTSFPNLDYKVVRDLGPGEIVRLRADGIEVMQKPFTRCQICSFLWVYYGFPASDYEGINTEYVREKNGRLMGEKDNDIEPDLVCGIPDSGVGMALGYSHGKQVPYKRAVLKYTPTWPRSFMPSRQETRDLVAKMKLIANKSLLKDRKVVFCDDSIVRGTTSERIVRMIRDAGAKEVHMRVSSPPFRYPCFFGTDVDSGENLIACRLHSAEEIAEEIGADSLAYLSVEAAHRLAGEINCGFCDGCFTGCYPIRIPEDQGKSRFEQPISVTGE
jgi:amidophosphoribosyltransferase